jgi:CRP-like cAMP-binding protein
MQVGMPARRAAIAVAQRTEILDWKQFVMTSDHFFEKVDTYAHLSAVSRNAWRKLLREESFRKAESFIELGGIARKVGFVVKGLLSQNHISESGEATIKYFFPEGRFAASVAAMLSRTPSKFSVIAVEDTRVLSYDFSEFKKLTEQYRDIASFYIHYMERHWIVEKEPLEISFRRDTALKRYNDFLAAYPRLVNRLKKHQIASYLGITPTQLSRLFVSQK